MRTLSRKLQKLPSNGSFLLTLPKDWCEDNKLQAGDDLAIAVNAMGDGTLLISLPQMRDENERIADLKFGSYTEGSALSRAILSRYLEGYEVINISGIPMHDEERFQTEELVDSLLNKLDGCSANKLGHRFELLVKKQEKSPREVLKQLYMITNEMFGRAISLLFDFKEVNAQILIKRENESDKLYFSIVRSLKQMLQNPFEGLADDKFELVDTLEYRMVASNLENLSDAAESIAEGMINHLHGKINGNINVILDPDYTHTLSSAEQARIEDLGNGIKEILHTSFECFETNDEKLAIQLGENREELKEKLLQLRRLDLHPLVISLFEEGIECIVDILELVGE